MLQGCRKGGQIRARAPACVCVCFPCGICLTDVLKDERSITIAQPSRVATPTPPTCVLAQGTELLSLLQHHGCDTLLVGGVMTK